MIIILSPAKTLDFETEIKEQDYTLPDFIDKADKLVGKLKKLSPKQLSDTLNISTRLANLNHDRYQVWNKDFNDGNARPAVLTFKGDVYIGLNAGEFSKKELAFAQEHLRILSGMYGLLRPLDLIKAYRLEMGSDFHPGKGKSLYDYWGKDVTDNLKRSLGKNRVLINLASNEYFKVLDKKQLDAEIITPVFKDYKNGQYKIISFFAKKARGQMAAFIIRNRIEDPDELKHFEEDGYYYNDELSEKSKIVFTRG